MNLAKDIAYLLYKHNCVIIPDFGAFLVNEKKAERNLNAKFANPKTKAISFNAQITNNDGLLANFLSNKYKYSYERGLSEIKTYVTELNSKLQDKRNAEVSEIGTFYLTKEEKLLFIPYHSVNFEITSYGLPKLRLKTVQTVSTTNVSKVEKSIITVAQPIKKTVPTVVANTAKKIEVQEKKRIIKQEEKLVKSEGKRNKLAWLNALGILLIIAVAAGITHYELTNKPNAGNNFADLLDTPSTVNNNAPAEVIVHDELTDNLAADSLPATNITSADLQSENKNNAYKLNLYAICTQPQADTFAAEKLKEELLPQFEGAFVWKENDNFRVQIIALSKEKLAKEYKEMAQRKTKQQLVIKQK